MESSLVYSIVGWVLVCGFGFTVLFFQRRMIDRIIMSVSLATNLVDLKEKHVFLTSKIGNHIQQLEQYHKDNLAKLNSIDKKLDMLLAREDRSLATKSMENFK